jgi:outer membrane protein insertion porin family
LKLFFSFLIFITATFSQENVESVKINNIKTRGNIITSDNTILFTAGLKKGQLVSPVDFPRAIKRLWKLGLFQDIQIEFEEETNAGLDIIIFVSENYVLNKIQFSGNKKLKDSKIIEELSLSEGQRIKINTLNKSEELIKKLYAEKGFLNIEIQSKLVVPKEKITLFGGRGKELARNLSFEIKENNKTKISKVLFNGNETFSDFKLRWQLKETKQQPWYFFWRSTFDKTKFKEDMSLLTAFYKNKGYRDFRVLSDSVQFSEDKKKINLVLTLEEGPSYKYRNFSWEGMSLFSKNELERALSLKKGDKYNEEAFNMAVYSRVQGLYLDRGYIYSRIEPQITPVGKDSLDVNFSIVENHKVYINQIAIIGNTRTRENVIRRQLRVFPGDV